MALAPYTSPSFSPSDAVPSPGWTADRCARVLQRQSQGDDFSLFPHPAPHPPPPTWTARAQRRAAGDSSPAAVNPRRSKREEKTLLPPYLLPCLSNSFQDLGNERGSPGRTQSRGCRTLSHTLPLLQEAVVAEISPGTHIDSRGEARKRLQNATAG